MAFAVRLGQAADKKTWEKYCKAPPVGVIPLLTYKGPQKEKPKRLTNKQTRELQKQLRK